jgi:hypothetical protein
VIVVREVRGCASGDQTKISGCRRVHRHIESPEAIRKRSVSLPVHALRLWRQAVRYCPAASKPDMQLLQPAQCSIMWLLTLTVVCKLMTLTAGEDPATVQNGYAPTASRQAVSHRSTSSKPYMQLLQSA